MVRSLQNVTHGADARLLSSMFSIFGAYGASLFGLSPGGVVCGQSACSNFLTCVLPRLCSLTWLLCVLLPVARAHVSLSLLS